MNNEEILLNAIIQIKNAFLQVKQFINEKSFTNAYNRMIYELLAKIIDEGKNIDLVTLILYATNEKKEHIINHIYNITSVEPTLNYLEFAKELNKQECLKSQHDLALKMIDASKNGVLINYDDIINSIKTPRKRVYKTASELYYELSSEINNMPIYQSGIKVVDEALKGGFQTGSFVLISGEPEAGKSMFGLQVIENIANAKHKAAYFCFEFINRDYIRLKMQVDENMSYVTPFYEKDNFQNLIVISDDYSLDDVANNIRALAADKTKFFLIDSQMRIENKDGRSLEEEESSKFSTLAKLAHSLDVCIILIVQTNKTDTQTPSGTKKGAHEANIIIRIETEKINKVIKPTERYIIIQKNKQSGMHNKFRVEFNPLTCQFGELIYDKDTSRLD